MLTASEHSKKRIIRRLNIDPLNVLGFIEDWLTKAQPRTLEEICEIVYISKPDKRDCYYVVPDPHLPGEQVVLITRDDKVVTILTRLTARMHEDGTTIIKTLGGKEVQGDNRWIKTCNRIRKKPYKRH